MSTVWSRRALPTLKYEFSIKNYTVFFQRSFSEKDFVLGLFYCFSVYLIQTVNSRFRIFNYPNFFVIRVNMWLFMELWTCLKTNLIVFGTAFDKATVIHFLDATIKIAPVGVLCIFGSQYIMDSVLKSFSNSKSNLLERVILWSVTSFFSLSTSLSLLLCVPCNNFI